MKKNYVSIVVPVYNNARCIKKCIESIREQTYSKLQIILVDDGSTDGSGDICEEYVTLDSRIEVYRLENRGVSSTRNYGLKKAWGEFIQFVDADDCIKNSMTEILVRKMQGSDADMVVCNYVKDFQKMKAISNRLESPGKYSNIEYLQHTLRDPGHHYYGVVWNKLYRTRVIKDNDLKFDERVNLGEDFIFNLHYWLQCKSVLVIKDYLYIYNKENDMTLSNVKKKEITDCEKELHNRKMIFAEYEEVFRRIGLYSKCYSKIQFYWIIFYVRQLYGFKNEYRSWSEEDILSWKKQLASSKEIRTSIKAVSKREQALYSLWYHMDYKIKKLVKRMGGIE